MLFVDCLFLRAVRRKPRLHSLFQPLPQRAVKFVPGSILLAA